MKKNDLPAMPFYVGDWFKAPEVRALNHEEKGVWLEMLFLMWESTARGKLIWQSGEPYSPEDIAKVLNLDIQKCNQILTQLNKFGCYSVEKHASGIDIIYSRRMVRDEANRKIWRENAKKGGNPKLRLSKFGYPKTNQNTEDEDEDEKTLNPSGLKEGNARGGSQDADFETFWAAYPRKTAKGNALKSWKKQKPPIEKVLAALKWQCQSEQWIKDNGQFIPHPATYLNGGRWQDEPQKTKQQIEYV